MTKSLSPEDIKKIEKTINEYVGMRLRQGRTSINMSQPRLAEFFGVAFQQIQKYESGANRVSAAKLFRFSQLLGETPNYFFDGLHDGKPETIRKQQTIFTVRTQRLAKRFLRAPPDIQKAIDIILKHYAPRP